MRNVTQVVRAFVCAALMTTTLVIPTITLADSHEIIDPWAEEDAKPKGNGFLQSISGGAGSTADKAGFGESKPLPEFVGGIIQGLISLAGIALVVLVFYGGFLWMSAQGSDEKIKKAKGIITSAVIGLVIIFAASAITTQVVRLLTVASAP